jgi:hypothetical protein
MHAFAAADVTILKSWRSEALRRKNGAFHSVICRRQRAKPELGEQLRHAISQT